MPKWFFLLCWLAFLGGLFTGKSVLSQPEQQEWSMKPIQCGPVYDVLAEMQAVEMSTAFGGLGTANSVNTDKPIPVYVYLSVNLQTNQWAVLEINYEYTEACIIGYGQGAMFDPKQLKEFTNPKRFYK